MFIQSMRCYFTYGVPISNTLDIEHEDHLGVCIMPDLIDRVGQKFSLQAIQAPAFYTEHYRTQHTPYQVTDPSGPACTSIPKEKLNALAFFRELDLTQDVGVSWEFSLRLHSIGLITLCFHLDEVRPAALAYRLSGLYLNPAYAVIATEPIAHLWRSNPAQRPEFVTPDELARAIHASFFSQVGLPVHRYKTLRHEMQIPFIAAEVQSTCATQHEFIEQESSDLAEMVFRPACWEVEHTSRIHIANVLEASRMWSVSRDVLVFTSYETCVYLKFQGLSVPETLTPVSEFYLTSEAAILHTFQVSVANYLFLRVLDDLLERRMERLVEQVHDYQDALNASTTDNDQPILKELDALTVHITYLRFRLLDLLEEISNSDKLIDEEYHIILLDKMNNVLGTRAWFEGLNRRIENLRQLVETIESTYERLANLQNTRQIQRFEAQMLQINLENQKLDQRLEKAQPFFEALAAVEALNLFIYIWFDPNFPMSSAFSRSFHWTIDLPGQIVSTVLVCLGLFSIIKIIHWIAYRRAQNQEKTGGNP